MDLLFNIFKILSLSANGILAIMCLIVILRSKECDLRNFYICTIFCLLNIITILGNSSALCHTP